MRHRIRRFLWKCLAIPNPSRPGLVMWPSADVEHYEMQVQIAGLKSDIERLKAQIAPEDGCGHR